MANKYNNLSELFTATANAIRSKTGSTDPIVADDFPEVIEGMEVGGGGSTEEWIGDGNTHLWITLQEGRTSPVLGICVQGTVTVDWGDGSAPNVLTGTSTSSTKWTPNHEYAAAGDYVITLSSNGAISILGQSTGTKLLAANGWSTDADRVYRSAIQKVELGDNVTSIGNYAFSNCYSLASISIPDSVTSIGNSVFNMCYNLENVTFPDGVTSIGSNIFTNCCSLENVTIPDGVTSIVSNMFYSCYSLENVTIPDGVTSIGSTAFSMCYSLKNVTIPDGVTSIETAAFQNCYSLASISIPDSVTSIGNSAFNSCGNVAYYDFSNHTAVPTLSATNAFSGIASDCQIRVPAALVDEWKAATNWSTYADNIVGV